MKNGYPLALIEALPSWSKCQLRQEKVRFLGTSSSTDSSTSAAQIVVEYNGVDAGGGGKSVEKSSKVEKPPRPQKSQRPSVRRNQAS